MPPPCTRSRSKNGGGGGGKKPKTESGGNDGGGEQHYVTFKQVRQQVLRFKCMLLRCWIQGGSSGCPVWQQLPLDVFRHIIDEIDATYDIRTENMLISLPKLPDDISWSRMPPFPPVAVAAHVGDWLAVRSLVEKFGHAVDQPQPILGITAAMRAAEAGHSRVLSVLHDLNADFEVQCPVYRYSALMLAAKSHNADCLRLLALWKCRLDATDSCRRSVVECACMCGSQGYNPGPGGGAVDWGGVEGAMESCLMTLKDAGCDMDRMNPRLGTTPLLQVAQLGHVGAFRCLLGLGCDIGVVSSSGDGVAHYAVGDDGDHCDRLALLRFLHERQIDMRRPGSGGKTPLHWAAGHDLEHCVRLILQECCCDPNAVDQQGQSPGWAAADLGNLCVLKALHENGATFAQRDHRWDWTVRDVATHGQSQCSECIAWLESINAPTAHLHDDQAATQANYTAHLHGIVEQAMNHAMSDSV